MKLNIIYGPPCSGKSTYVKKNIKDNQIVYDYDEIARAITYGTHHAIERGAIHQYVIDYRLSFLKRLKIDEELEEAWLITSYPTDEFKGFVEGIDVKYKKMDASLEECLKRLEKDESRIEKEEWAERIKDWFEKHEKEVKSMPLKPGERQYRNLVELIPARADVEEYKVEGYATTFTPYLLWEYDGVKYYEEIDSRAFDDADMSDVIMQYDHNGKVFARTSNGSLNISIDERGLFVSADLSKSAAAREMHEEIKAGLVTKMSWAFTVAEESYNSETRTRKILKVKKVYDVSAVSIPANDGTEISARSFLDGVIEKEKQELLERALAVAIRELEIERGLNTNGN